MNQTSGSLGADAPCPDWLCAEVRLRSTQKLEKNIQLNHDILQYTCTSALQQLQHTHDWRRGSVWGGDQWRPLSQTHGGDGEDRSHYPGAQVPGQDQREQVPSSVS